MNYFGRKEQRKKINKEKEEKNLCKYGNMIIKSNL